MKKIAPGNKILKEEGVLLIITVMLLSTGSVAANLSISAQSTNSGKSESNIGTIGDILLDEGFEDGVMPPPGWSATDGWEITEEVVHNGTYAGFVPVQPVQVQDRWLISPEIDLTGAYVEVTLEFWCNTSLRYDGGTVKVYVSTDDNFDEGDIIWDMVADEDPEEWSQPLWRKKVLYLNESIGETVRIAWRYLATIRWSFALDDIIVFDSLTSSPHLEFGDITGGFSKACAEIKNVGEGDASDVNWSIGIYGPVRPIWDWNGTIQNLSSGESEIVCTDGFIFGFGKVDIEVTASEPYYGSSDTKTVKGFVFLCFIFVIDS